MKKSVFQCNYLTNSRNAVHTGHERTADMDLVQPPVWLQWQRPKWCSAPSPAKSGRPRQFRPRHSRKAG